MRVVRVVFEEEIKRFGLNEREVREVAGKVVRATDRDWDLNDVTVENGYCKIAIEVNGKFGGKFDSWANSLQVRAKEIFRQIEQALEDYAYVKQYVAIYNNCNGNGRNGSEEVKEIMRKVGIPVIS